MNNISGEQTLSGLFNGNTFYRIPDYQRGYAWEESQLNDFWKDLLNSKDSKHYTGVLSLEKVSDKEKEKPQWANDLAAKNGEAYYIVDGQQRLTTSVILLKVILDFVGDNEWFAGKKTQSLREKYIGAEAQSGEKHYFFGYTFDNPSYEFLKTQIFEEKLVFSKNFLYKGERSIYTKNLAFARDFFIKKLKENENDIEQIFKTLTQNFVFNVYEISSDFDVYVAFETMNNRGKPLSTLELLKNRLIYLSTKLGEKGEFLRKNINEYWKDIYKFLGKNDKKVLEDDDFLKVHWLMYFDKYERGKSNPHKEFLLEKHFTLKNLNEAIINADIMGDYAKNLKDCVEHYYFLYNLYDTEYKSKNNINDNSEMLVWLEKIQRLNFGAFEPLLVAVLYKRTENLKNGLNNDNDIVELLKDIEKFLFLMFSVSYRQSNFKEQDICKKAFEYFWDKKEIDDESGQEIEISLKFMQEFMQGIYYDMDLGQLQKRLETYFKDGSGYFEWKGLRYFLFEYEEHLCKEKGRKFNLKWKQPNEYKKDQITIEHILPQNAENVKEWNSVIELALKGTKRDNRKRLRQQLINSLGNLVPLEQSINSSLKDSPFDIKRKRYEEGSQSEREIIKKREWNSKAIEERTNKLLKFMFDRWDINDIIKYWEKNDGEWAKELKNIQKKLVFSIKKDN